MATVTLAERLAEQQRLKAAIEAARRVLDDFMRHWALDAPHKVGDVIEVTGYTHKGKQMRITSVQACEWAYHGPEWRYFGHVIKKDGTDGSARCESAERIEP